jgi:hypothetical protein
LNFSSGSDSFLAVTWSSMWNTVGARVSETMTCESLIVWYPAHHHFLQASNELGTVVRRFQNHLHRPVAKVFRPRDLKLYYSETDI